MNATERGALLQGVQLYDEMTSVPFLEAWGETVERPQRILVPAPLYHTNGFATLDFNGAPRNGM